MFMFLLTFVSIITSFVVCINREDLDFNLDDDEPEDRDVDATDKNGNLSDLNSLETSEIF